jgi:hypothetical protein
MRAVGERVPSEAVEWVWRSMKWSMEFREVKSLKVKG